jgi:hypothetical protein
VPRVPPDAPLHPLSLRRVGPCAVRGCRRCHGQDRLALQARPGRQSLRPQPHRDGRQARRLPEHRASAPRPQAEDRLLLCLPHGQRAGQDQCHEDRGAGAEVRGRAAGRPLLRGVPAFCAGLPPADVEGHRRPDHRCGGATGLRGRTVRLAGLPAKPQQGARRRAHRPFAGHLHTAPADQGRDRSARQGAPAARLRAASGRQRAGAEGSRLGGRLSQYPHLSRRSPDRLRDRLLGVLRNTARGRALRASREPLWGGGQPGDAGGGVHQSGGAPWRVRTARPLLRHRSVPGAPSARSPTSRRGPSPPAGPGCRAGTGRAAGARPAPSGSA